MADKKSDPPPAGNIVQRYRFRVVTSDGRELVSHVASNTRPAPTQSQPAARMVDVPVHRILVAVKGGKQGRFADEHPPGFVDLAGVSPTHQFSTDEISFAFSEAHDAATGAPTGRRMHTPLAMVKQTGPATPEFQNALVTNETLAELIFDCYGNDPSGRSALAASVKLTRATVASIDFEMLDARKPGATAGACTDRITFTFGQIEIDFQGSSISDVWRT